MWVLWGKESRERFFGFGGCTVGKMLGFRLLLFPGEGDLRKGLGCAAGQTLSGGAPKPGEGGWGDWRATGGLLEAFGPWVRGQDYVGER